MDKNESTPQQWIGLHKREGWMDSIDYEDELGHANGGNSVYPSAENCEANNKCITDSRENPEEYPCTAMRVYVFAADEFDVALRSVAGGEPEQWLSPQTDLPDEDEAVLVAVSCEADDHDGGTQRWPEVHEATLYKAGSQLVAACFADNAEYLDGEILGWRPLPAPPQGKEQK